MAADTAWPQIRRGPEAGDLRATNQRGEVLAFGVDAYSVVTASLNSTGHFTSTGTEAVRPPSTVTVPTWVPGVAAVGTVAVTVWWYAMPL